MLLSPSADLRPEATAKATRRELVNNRSVEGSWPPDSDVVRDEPTPVPSVAEGESDDPASPCLCINFLAKDLLIAIARLLFRQVENQAYHLRSHSYCCPHEFQRSGKQEYGQCRTLKMIF